MIFISTSWYVGERDHLSDTDHPGVFEMSFTKIKFRAELGRARHA